MLTEIEILNVSLEYIARIKSLYPIDRSGNILTYSKELSDYGTCRFRVSTDDPTFNTYGDILKPHEYHVRVRRNGTVVWQGAIVANPQRNKNYVEVEAAEYEFYLDRKLINRTSADINGTQNIYRTFKSGTMSTAITALVNEAIADYSTSNHVLSGMTVGTIENPDYPPNMTSDYDQSKLTGAWSFGESTAASKGPTVQFDFHTLSYVLKSFGIYTYSDFEIDSSLRFNFKKFLGNNRIKEIVFRFGRQGNIIDYSLSRDGKSQYNSIIGIATDPFGVVLHSDQTDQTSVTQYGLMEGVAAYADVKGQSLLNARTKAELDLVSKPIENSATVYLNEKGYPLGQYDIGDLVKVEIEDGVISFNQIRRIIGITVVLHNTGQENVAVQTNKPQEWQYES